MCKVEGASCDLSRKFAFSSIDITDMYAGNPIYQYDNVYDYSYPAGDIYCCQDGRNCIDGFDGCQTACTACCDTDDCSNDIRYTVTEFFACNSDNTCVNFAIGVPMLYVSGNTYNRLPRQGETGQIDWSAQGYTCSELRSNRITSQNYPDGSCQRDGKADTDIPCIVWLFSFDSDSSFCPSECQSYVSENKNKRRRLA